MRIEGEIIFGISLTCRHYPDWEYEYDIDMIIEDIAGAFMDHSPN
jgi:hypothetical protein